MVFVLEVSTVRAWRESWRVPRAASSLFLLADCVRRVNTLAMSFLSTFDATTAVGNFLSMKCNTLEEGYRAAVVSGCLALSVHLVVSQCLKLCGRKALSKDTGFVAHQVVALGYMVALFGVGGLEWWSGAGRVGSAEGRLFDGNPTSRWLAAITFGQMVAWDIPCGFGLVPSMSGDKIMVGHHVIMAFVAWVGMYSLPSYYYLFFFGFCELSSIPLVFVDFFHPKRFAQLAEESALLKTFNEVNRLVFAGLFIAVRACYFPYVYATMLIPDILDVYTTPSGQTNAALLWSIAFSATSLTLLQLYWAGLIGQQILKMLGGKKEDPKTD